MGLSMKEKKKLTVEIAKKYCVASKKEKGMILDVFVSQTGYNRKYAISVLCSTAEVRTVNFNNSPRKRVCLKKQRQRAKRIYNLIMAKMSSSRSKKSGEHSTSNVHSCWVLSSESISTILL